MPTTDTDLRVTADPLYALLAVALLQNRDSLRHGPYAAQVAALDAMIGLCTLAREQAVRKGKLRSALPVKQARCQSLPLDRSPVQAQTRSREEQRHANR